jgi:uncharacterized membrane-anchored protein
LVDRLDVDRQQNQQLLESMDARSDSYCGCKKDGRLSIVAISYYAVSLVAHLLSPPPSLWRDRRRAL